MVQKGRLLLVQDCDCQEIFERLVSRGYGVERIGTNIPPRLADRRPVAVATSDATEFIKKYGHELRNTGTPLVVYSQHELEWDERETMKGMASYGHFDLRFATVPGLGDAIDIIYRERNNR